MATVKAMLNLTMFKKVMCVPDYAHRDLVHAMLGDVKKMSVTGFDYLWKAGLVDKDGNTKFPTSMNEEAFTKTLVSAAVKDGISLMSWHALQFIQHFYRRRTSLQLGLSKQPDGQELKLAKFMLINYDTEERRIQIVNAMHYYLSNYKTFWIHRIDETRAPTFSTFSQLLQDVLGAMRKNTIPIEEGKEEDWSWATPKVDA